MEASALLAVTPPHLRSLTQTGSSLLRGELPVGDTKLTLRPNMSRSHVRPTACLTCGMVQPGNPALPHLLLHPDLCEINTHVRMFEPHLRSDGRRGVLPALLSPGATSSASGVEWPGPPEENKGRLDASTPERAYKEFGRSRRSSQTLELLPVKTNKEQLSVPTPSEGQRSTSPTSPASPKTLRLAGFGALLLKNAESALKGTC